MNYLEELSLELNKLRNGKYVKVNIHLNINGELLALCKRINKEVANQENNYIIFNEKSIIVPHISLFMGYINSFEQFEFVLEAAHDFASQTKSVCVDPTRLYISDTSFTLSKYLLLDILQNEEIRQYKHYFFNMLYDNIKPMEWDFINEHAHITLNCFDKVPRRIEKILDKYHEFPNCNINDIGISISGKKGVCFGNLKTFSLL